MRSMRAADVALANIRIGDWVPDTRHSREGRAWERSPRMQLTEQVTFSQVFFAAAAVRRDVFAEVGGFDEAFTEPGRYGNEDMDLGLRLAEAGARIRRIPDVVRTDLVTDEPTLLRRWQQVGRADVELARKHPQVAGQPIDRRARSRSHRATAAAVRRLPHLGSLAPGLLVILRLLDAIGLERTVVADRLWRAARALCYWQGVAEASSAVSDPTVHLRRDLSP